MTSSAAPTLTKDEVVKELRGFAWQFKFNGLNPSLHTEFSKFIDSLEAQSAPTAAERTALTRIQKALLDYGHFSEVCDRGKLVYHKDFVDRLIKAEIDAASEGRN